MSTEVMNERRPLVLAAQTFFCHHRISWAGRRCVDGAAVVRGHLMRQTAAQSPSRNLLSFCSLAALDRTGPRDLASKARAEDADVGGRGRGEGLDDVTLAGRAIGIRLANTHRRFFSLPEHPPTAAPCRSARVARGTQGCHSPLQRGTWRW